MSVTFNGCSSNIGMTKNLGCMYDVSNLKTYFMNIFQPVICIITGFIGFLQCFESLLKLHSLLIVPRILKFLLMYKFSQNCLKLLFGAIRTHGGHNNNPTDHQFYSVFRKLIVHAEIREGGLGNCIPYEQIE